MYNPKFRAYEIGCLEFNFVIFCYPKYWHPAFLNHLLAVLILYTSLRSCKKFKFEKLENDWVIITKFNGNLKSNWVIQFISCKWPVITHTNSIEPNPIICKTRGPQNNAYNSLPNLIILTSNSVSSYLDYSYLGTDFVSLSKSVMFDIWKS